MAKVRTKRHWTVGVYREDGTDVGITTLDSRYDTVDNQSVNTRALAEEYAKRYLVGKGQYSIVMT